MPGLLLTVKGPKCSILKTQNALQTIQFIKSALCSVSAVWTRVSTIRLFFTLQG